MGFPVSPCMLLRIDAIREGLVMWFGVRRVGGDGLGRAYGR
jgi:hypothetical protein